MEKPAIALFSESNFFSLNLVENLLSKNCTITIFCEDKKSWLFKTKHITNKSSIIYADDKLFSGLLNFKYIIFKLEFEKFLTLYTKYDFKQVKSLAIFSFDTFSSDRNSRIPQNGNLGIVYLGDIIGPRIDLDNDILIEKIIGDSMSKREVNITIGDVFYPIFVMDAVREVVKWVFSFGPYGKEVFLLGDQISGNELWQLIRKSVPDVRLTYNSNKNPRFLPRNFEVKKVTSNLNFAFKETIAWFSKPTAKLSKQKLVNKTGRARSILRVLLPILFFPFLCILTNSGLFYLSYKSYTSGDSQKSRAFLLFSKTISFIGGTESRALSYIPFAGRVYSEANYALDLSRRLSEVGINTMYVGDSGKEIVGKILGDEIYDPEKYSSALKINLDYIYQNVSLADLETKNQKDKGVYLAGLVSKKVDFERIKELVSETSNMADGLSEILGKNKKTSYLILFQNNMELRPTGGFIGSFGILSFEGGRMVDLSVSDIYSADGQLRGHVEPPDPIKKYLGEANWWFRDSNWDPDFVTSAIRAEWFLDKEVDRQVDGVISVDLAPIKEVLKHTGSIYLADYQMDITSDNLYDKTQAEVHEDFFPGTHKKASFLTALSRNLVSEITKMPPSKKLLVLKTLYQGLETKHIQVYMHNTNWQEALSQLNWNGGVRTLSCDTECYSDLIGLVEANVGVNKANYFVSRSLEININTHADKIVRQLILKIHNSANPELGLPGKYKAYVRVLVPKGVTVEGSGFDFLEGPDTSEIGFLVEVLGGSTQEYVVSWSSPGKDTSTYGVYIRKQAGTGEEDKASVAIDGKVLYNSNLVKDIWIQKP